MLPWILAFLLSSRNKNMKYNGDKDDKRTMNLLFISPYLTMPKIGAGVGCYSHLTAIRECIDEENLTIIAINYTGTAAKNLDKNIIIIDSFRNQKEKIKNILTFNGICLNKRVIKNVLLIIENKNIDTVFVDESILGRLCKEIKKLNSNIKIISFYHDVKANLCRQWIRQNGLKVLPYNLGLMLNEKMNVSYADINVVLNDREAKMFKDYYNQTVDYLLPHFTVETDFSYDECLKRNDNDRFFLLFVGADYRPNIEGVRWFINFVMPYIQKNIFLHIVGKGMEKYRNEFNEKRIQVVGTAESLMEWYINADVIISPVFEGGGMKTKTAEALQYGKCIIATTESFEGYAENIPDDFWGKYCWIANNAEEYIEILNSLETRKVEKYNKELNELYVENYSLCAGVRKMKLILDLNMNS